MSYMQNLNDAKGILIERTENYGCYLMPRFYMNEWAITHLCHSKDEEGAYDYSELKTKAEIYSLNYCLFIEEENIDERVGKLKELFPNLEMIEKIEPSYLDKLLHFLNPRNQNENIYIYRLN